MQRWFSNRSCDNSSKGTLRKETKQTERLCLQEWIGTKHDNNTFEYCVCNISLRVRAEGKFTKNCRKTLITASKQRPVDAPKDYYRVVGIESTAPVEAQDEDPNVVERHSQFIEYQAPAAESSRQPVVHQPTAYTYTTPQHSWLGRPLSREEKAVLDDAGVDVRGMTDYQQRAHSQRIQGDLARRKRMRESLNGIRELLRKPPSSSSGGSNAHLSLSKNLSYRQKFNYFHLPWSQCRSL